MNIKRLKLLIITLFVCTVLLFIIMFFEYLALTDIWHGNQPNFDLEWLIVQVSFYIRILFYIVNLVIFILLYRIIKKD
ncbi:MAG: hypothetical protein ABF289_19190 [Clostridiales bacterium]